MSTLLVGFLEDNHLVTHYFFNHFIASFYCKKVDPELLGDALQRLADGLVYNELTDQFCTVLRSAIRTLQESLSSRDELEAVTSIASLLKSRMDYGEMTKYFSAEYEYFYYNRRRYDNAGEAFVLLTQDYANACFGFKDDEKAATVLRRTLDIIDEFKFSSHSSRETSIALIKNRMCVAYKGIGLPDLAIAAATDSVNIALKYQDHTLEFRNNVDLGYVYYGSRDKVGQLQQSWRRAVEVFESKISDHDRHSKDRASATLIKVRLSIIEGRLDYAYHASDAEMTRCIQMHDTFHAIKAMLLKSLAIIAGNEIQRNTTEAIGIIERAQDYCVRHKSMRSYWTVFYLRGKLAELTEDVPHIIPSYHSALEQRIKHSNETAEMTDLFFFEDLAMALRKYSEPLNSELHRRIRSATVQMRINQLLTMHDQEFAGFLQNYKPTSTFFKGQTNLPCP